MLRYPADRLAMSAENTPDVNIGQGQRKETITIQPAGVSLQSAHVPTDCFLNLSILSNILCCLFCNWFGMACTVTAIHCAVLARNSALKGKDNKARLYGWMSFSLNVAALISFFVIPAFIIVLIYAML